MNTALRIILISPSYVLTMNQPKSYRLLKRVIALGGIFEAFMGLIILFFGDLVISLGTNMQTVPNYPLYWRTMGLLACALGSLQIIASFDPPRYVVIPIAASCVRLLLPILTLLQVADTPSMTSILVISTAFDFVLAIITILLLHKASLLKTG